MFLRLKKMKAQSTLEYAIIIAVVVAGMVAMQVYLRRGISGKMRTSADSIGDQFDPATSTGSFSTNSTSSSNEVVETTGVTGTNMTQTQTRTGSENMTP
jgi:hypothetical protein